MIPSNDNEEKLFREDKDLTYETGSNGSNTIKDPDNWTTGDEKMTGAQHSYLTTLSAEAGEAFDEKLTKAEASKRIEELQHKTGRGMDTN
ncbi:DUF3072 domain-containing protein [Mucilaginibacter sp.]|uniref:DUF3072 domain-containing protein n=1 Tax=Mucilaginibacter sp. TaxID=1882438 RepID=UPI003D13CBEC